MGKLSWKIFIIVLVMTMLVAVLPTLMACKAKEEAAPATPAQPAQPAQPQKVLKIGSVVTFSNKEGLELKKWMDLVMKVTNAQGGLKIGNDAYKVEIITYDAGSDDAKAREGLERLVFQDGCKILLNMFGVNEVLSAQICEQNKILGLGTGFIPEGADPKFNYYWRTTGIYFARAFHYLVYNDYFTKGAKTGVIINPESQSGHILAEEYGQAMKLAGLSVYPEIYYPSDTVDFGPIATKVKSLNADVVDLAGAGGAQAVDIISSLKDAGWKGYLSPSSLNKNQYDNLLQRVGKEYMEGTEMLYFDPRGIQKDPTMLKWLDEYTKEYGEFVETGCFWISGWWFLKDALEATKSTDTEVLKKYLDNMPHGVMTLDGYSQLFARPDVNNLRTIDCAPGHGIGMIKNGVMDFYRQVTVKDQYLVSIKAYNLVDVYQKYWDKYGKPTFPPEQAVFDFSDLATK
jgi:branched-chain amino acid transport system substrate-binding protein